MLFWTPEATTWPKVSQRAKGTEDLEQIHGQERRAVQGQMGTSPVLTRAENQGQLAGKWLATEMASVFSHTQEEARKALNVLSAPALVLHWFPDCDIWLPCISLSSVSGILLLGIPKVPRT